MLREDVLQSVQNAKFQIYAVSSIDEGIELLTGVPAGEKQKNRHYQEGSDNRAVEEHLEDLTRRGQVFTQEEEKDSSPQSLGNDQTPAGCNVC